MKIKTLFFERLCISLTVLLYGISIFVDVSIIQPPSFLLLTYESPDDLLLAIFSVQTSVSTIGIAVVSIITGVTNETVYGVSVSEYITSIKPIFFKHKTLTITSLILIFVNYMFVAFDLFNCAIVSLLVGIAIIVILVNNVTVIFKGKDYIRKEVLQYIKANYNEEIICNLNNETIDAIEGGVSITLKKNYEAYKEILEVEIEKIVNKEDPLKESSIISQLSNSISDIFEIISKTKDTYKISDAILFICDIYDIANNAPRAPVYLRIWDNISRIYFNSIKLLSYDQLKEEHACWNLRDKLYKNIVNQTEDKLKQCDLRMYSTWICVALCSQTEKFSPEEIKDIKRRTYENAYYWATYVDNRNGLNDVYLKEVCYLHKYFIETFDIESINELYFKELSIRIRNNNSKIIYIVTIIYLYYLSVREVLIDGKDLQKCAKSILDKNHNVNSHFFYDIDISNITEKSYDYIQTLMKYWEYMDEGELKWIIIDTVILDFFVFTALNAIWKEELLAEIIDVLVTGDMFSIYSRYFPSDNIDSLKANYQQFNEIFSEKLEEDSLINNILFLKSVFDKKYKEAEISNAKNNPITEGMLGGFKESCLQTVGACTSSKFDVFAFRDDICKEATWPVYEEKDVVIFSAVVPHSLFEKENFTSYFADSIEQNIGVCFLNTILPSIKYEKISYKNTKKQQHLLDAISQNDINVDIVIGDKNKRWNRERDNLLYDVISNASELRFPHMNNYYFVLASKFIEFSLDNFRVEFSDVELSDNCRKDEAGQIEYNITNNLFIPFDEPELKEYLHNTKRIVKIIADKKYRISKECVGAGISIVAN